MRCFFWLWKRDSRPPLPATGQCQIKKTSEGACGWGVAYVNSTLTSTLDALVVSRLSSAILGCAALQTINALLEQCAGELAEWIGI